MAEYFLMQIIYSSSSSVRPISDMCVSIGCSSTFLKQLYCQFRVSGYTGGLYIALGKYEKFK